MKKILLIILVSFIILLFSCQNEIINDPITLDINDGKKADFSQKDYIIYGDSQKNHYVHIDIVNLISKHNPKIIFHVGDLVHEKEDWGIFMNIIKHLLSIAEFHPALGNHDDEESFFKYFTFPDNKLWYIIETNEIDFIILNSNESLDIDSEQYNWLEATLQNIDTQTKFTAVIFHHPVYTIGEDHEPRVDLRNSIIPLFEIYNVDIIFNGHCHNYQRFYVDGIYYIVTGVSGGTLKDKERDDPNCQKFVKIYNYCTLAVENNKLLIEVIDVYSTIIDEFIIINE